MGKYPDYYVCSLPIRGMWLIVALHVRHFLAENIMLHTASKWQLILFIRPFSLKSLSELINFQMNMNLLVFVSEDAVVMVDNDVLAMSWICPFQINSLGESPFCDIFTEKEWIYFNYARDLATYYGSGYISIGRFLLQSVLVTHSVQSWDSHGWEQSWIYLRVTRPRTTTYISHCLIHLRLSNFQFTRHGHSSDDPCFRNLPHFQS